MIELKGWARTSLIDYPGHIATVLFTGGCNFRCPPCHNADLVLRPGELPTLPREEVEAYLDHRVGLIDGVVITGGEPTVQPDLIPFLRWLRAYDVEIKLDSNGYRPGVLEALLAEGLVDYVAMDVKAPPAKYPLVAGRPNLDLARIERSIGLLQGGNLACEFRTTVVPTLLDGEDIVALARWLAGLVERPAELRYILQPFRPHNTLDPDLEQVSPYPLERLRAMANRAGRWVGEVEVRGE